MRRTSFAAAACATALVMSATGVAQGPSADNSKAFNGTSLAGWQPLGAAQWRVANGEIVGTAPSGPGLLMLDKSYQDIILRFAYQCDNCDAGVLLRNGAASSKPDATTALYVGLSGPDARTLYRVTLNAQGREIDRTNLYKWTARQNPPGMQLAITPGSGGWTHVRVQVRGEVTAPAAGGRGGGAGAAPAGGAPPAPQETLPIYGPLSLRLANGELRVKDVTVTDLLRPAAGVAAEVTAPTFRRVQLTDRFYAEGISGGDINRDNVMDALSGPYAYLGPDFKRAIEIYKPQTYPPANASMAGQYTDNFLNYVHDFNGDGWNDYLKINFNGAYLYVNPKGESRYWTMHQVSEMGVSSETTQLGDIDGDNKPELLMSTGSGATRVVGILKPGADATQRWTFHAVSDKGDWGGHGYGFGDINGDGKHDIIQGSGWWEQPAAGATSGPWKFNAVPFGRGTDPFIRGADMFAYDVNGDKLPDVVTSLFAHGPGLAWFEQQRSGEGPITWKMHMIMDRPDASADERKTWEISDKNVVFTELHVLQLVDMDGDGLKDIVTGKRWFSHGMEYPENDRDDPPVVAWLKLVRKSGGQVEFVPNIINNYAGIGTQIAVLDMNGDKRPDVLTAQRKGAYVFFNNINTRERTTSSR
jgi:Domain of Unknown Function (DUF1080)/FG-GAP-like repeat